MFVERREFKTDPDAIKKIAAMLRADEAEAAAGWHDTVVRGIPQDIAALLVPPEFAHDVDTLPLKAADIAAWTIHRAHFEAEPRRKGMLRSGRCIRWTCFANSSFRIVVRPDMMLKLVEIPRSA